MNQINVAASQDPSHPQLNVAASQDPSHPQLNVAASQDPSHPQHNFHLGQILATVLLGLSAYRAVSNTGQDAKALLDPNLDAQLISGFSQIWVQPS